MVAEWDAWILTGNDENYNIQSGANRLGLKLNGVQLPVITLTTGASRTAAEIAAELNAVSEFSAQAEAYADNGHNNWGMTPSAVVIRTRGATLGSIEVQDPGQSAHVALGLPLGALGPAATVAERIVIQQAFQDWEALIQDGGKILSPYTVRVFYSLGVAGGTVAGGGPIYSGSNIVGGNIGFQRVENWYVDPTPWEDSEFAGIPPVGVDLLTIARHELGHALGWVGGDGLLDVTTSLTANLSASATSATVASTVGFFPSGQFIVGGELIQYSSMTSTLLLGLTRENPVAHSAGATVTCGNVYDSPRLNIAVQDEGAHTFPTYHPGDIMRPLFGNGVRSPISLYPAAARISRGQDARVPLSVVDVGGSPMPDGRASHPWPDLTNASGGTAAGIPFLLAAGTYLEPVLPLVISSPHELLLARDAVVLVH